MKKYYVFVIIMLFWAMGGKVFSQSSEVRIVYDYLYVYPKELGTFSSYPSYLVSQINSQEKFNINTWRLPTMEELEILVANRTISNVNDYMTKSTTSQKKVLLVTTKEEIERGKFIDLGLPSGTLWKYKNETRGGDSYITYDYALLFRKNLPSKKQFQELIDKCQWTWSANDRGYKVVGPNGKFIILPADGMVSCQNQKSSFGTWGMYWVLDSSSKFLLFTFSPSIKQFDTAGGAFSPDCVRHSVRLISNP